MGAWFLAATPTRNLLKFGIRCCAFVTHVRDVRHFRAYAMSAMLGGFGNSHLKTRFLYAAPDPGELGASTKRDGLGAFSSGVN